MPESHTDSSPVDHGINRTRYTRHDRWGGVERGIDATDEVAALRESEAIATAEMKAAWAEVERMRPVVDAACAYIDDEDLLTTDLRHAVDAFRAAQQETTDA